MPHPVALITERVRERVRRDGIDLTTDRSAADRLVRAEVQRYSERALGGSVPMLTDERDAERRVLADLVGLGPLQPYLDDANVEEIWINSPDRVFVSRGGASELTGLRLTSAQVRDLVERMLQTTGRRVDLSSPFVDASLPDGSRLHVAIPDVTRREWAVNIRKFSRRIGSLSDLVHRDSLTPEAAEFLRAAVRSGLNIIVSGATHAGKTTLLGALLAEAGDTERIITVEETFELDLGTRDVVALQCRQASLEGAGEITLRRLVKESLRMRPDRLVVGEVREAEALDLLIALNSGVPGACSVHSNGAREALAKLSILPLLAGRNIDSSFVLPTVAGVVDIVIHCEQRHDGHRRVAEIIAPTGAVDGGVVAAVPLFDTVGGHLLPTGQVPPRAAKFEAAGFSLAPAGEA